MDDGLPDCPPDIHEFGARQGVPTLVAYAWKAGYTQAIRDLERHLANLRKERESADHE